MEKSRAIELLEHLAWDGDIERNPYGDALNMAIEALKAQLSHEGTTSDLISRTETVEHLRRVLEVTVPNTDYDEGYIDGIEFGISTVSTMPTIQPVATDTNVGDNSEIPNNSDCISRQAAIDAVVRVREYHAYDEIEELRALPTIQPEPTDEQVAEYCKRRCLHVVTDDFFRAAQLEPKWIPCSERMPEKTPLWKTVGYLATVTCDSWEEPRTMYVKWETTTVRGKEVSRWTFDNRLFPSEWRVVAWMPLPEAYKKGGERI